ncbi:hypothetical protein WICMUC_004818 [Wickerhamomyces mucosus]|uniref:Uncharacterized protein n=1 Tax=Wickerhamomyces mucosus TaxID=1378264 RepID=A0A9P8T9Q5_9ASCO|nr:hypothetical protein WICMUC_004818 [Wickerhamomyces mucosus]
MTIRQVLKLRDRFGQLNPIHGIIFDMDGTLSISQPWMFKSMRSSIGLKDPGVDILSFIEGLPGDKQKEAQQKIAFVEEKAMLEMEPQLGLLQLIYYIQDKGLPKAILTRNLIKPVKHLVGKFLPDIEFDPILTREFQPPKPKPDAILHIAKTWGLDSKNLIMVGDSMDDVKSGFDAGAFTILIKSEMNEAIRNDPRIDYVVDSLDGIIELFEI